MRKKERDREIVLINTVTDLVRALSPSRPQCRRAVDNLMPEGNLLVSTELSSNFLPVVARRPSSARREFSRRRDTLRTEGQVRRMLPHIDSLISSYWFRFPTKWKVNPPTLATTLSDPRYTNLGPVATVQLLGYQPAKCQPEEMMRLYQEKRRRSWSDQQRGPG